MAAINNVTLIGRVVRDIEVKTTNSGKAVASFALAVDGYGKDADASFIDCVAWNKAAELLAEYAPKGKQIGITGRLQTRIWEKDDIKRKATEVIIDQFQFLSDAKGSGNNAAPATERYAEDDAKATKATTNQAAKTTEDIDLGTPIDLSEIPFRTLTTNIAPSLGGQIRIYRVGRQPQELLAHLSHPQDSKITVLVAICGYPTRVRSRK